MQSNFLWSNSFYRKVSKEADLETIIQASRDQILHDAKNAAELLQSRNSIKTDQYLKTEPSISMFL